MPEDMEPLQDFNLSDYEDKDSGAVNEKERLLFAKYILGALFVLVIIVFTCSYNFVDSNPENKELVAVVNTILDITKTAVPSIVTLVLGFYFGKKDT
ncbi:hypothetical protein [Aeromonas dhakensis]|uniref:hypothetical protein n=1 Tax=Aeromonas dhakensis TaxID=196024 RepID=UPI0038CF9B53